MLNLQKLQTFKLRSPHVDKSLYMNGKRYSQRNPTIPRHFRDEVRVKRGRAIFYLYDSWGVNRTILFFGATIKRMLQNG